MAYTIVFLKNERVLGSIPWPHSFNTARQHALDYFAINEKSLGATEVRVLDKRGGMVFHHPRTLDGA